MADYEERDLDDLTEEPSQHKLDELRAKGQVVQSRELTGTLVLLGTLAAVYFLGGHFYVKISSFMKELFNVQKMGVEMHDWKMFVDVGGRAGLIVIGTFLAVGGVGMVLGILASVAQSGFLLSLEAIQPDFKRVNPLTGLQKIFSFQSLTEATKSVLKFIVIIGVVYNMLKSEIFIIPEATGMGTTQMIAYMAKIIMKVFFTVAFLLLGTSAIDYFVQWRRFRKQAMMTKQEAKQEMKEREGDPQLKARIRSIQRETARKRMMKAVPKADVIVTNPTHFAVAIQYNPEESFAPKIVAKGADFIAQRIKELAREHNVPIVENVALARTLYKHVKVGQMVPRSLYQAVAEVLAYVYRLKGRKSVGGQKNSSTTAPLNQ